MKLNMFQAAVILLVAAGVLGSVVLGVNELLPAPAYPKYLWPFINALKYVLTTSAVAPLFAMIANLYGYLIHRQDEKIQYEAKELLKTWLTYEAYIKAMGPLFIAVTMGTPYAIYAYWITGSVAFIVDKIRKSFSEIAGAQ